MSDSSLPLRALFAAGLMAGALAGGVVRAAEPQTSVGASTPAQVSAAPKPEEIAYTVTPELDGGRLRDLAVSISFKADPSGRTWVHLPASWSGAHELWRAIDGVSAKDARAERPEPARLVLTSRPNAPVSLTYRIRQDFQGEMSTAVGSPFRPITRPTWFTAVGWASFAQIEGRTADPVSFRWGPTPPGWTLASNLDRPARAERRIDALMDSVLTGGEGMSVVEQPADGGRVRVAMHGQWKVSAAQLAQLQGRIAAASGAFWNEHGDDLFVVLTPLQAPPGQTAQFGVNLGEAFALWATHEVDGPSLRHILAHEHQHVWLPNRIGGVRTGADEPLDYWLSEGFTDFYTLRILLRSGVYSLEDFVADYNRILAAYAASPVKEAPNAMVRARFWSDRAIADLPYQRGLLLAARWDDRLRRLSGGKADLDEVVLAMKAMTTADAGAETAPLAQANLKTAFFQLGGGDLSGDYARFVEGGRRVLLPEDLFGDCAKVRTSTAPSDLSPGERLAAETNAARPGALVYRTASASVAGPMRDLAAGRPTLLLQQIELTPNMSPQTRARCTALMAGER